MSLAAIAGKRAAVDPTLAASQRQPGGIDANLAQNRFRMLRILVPEFSLYEIAKILHTL